jgi:hypothetical protein
MAWRVNIKIHFQHRSYLAVGLMLVVLAAIFFGYLGVSNARAVASSQSVPAVPSSRIRGYYLTNDSSEGSQTGGINGNGAGVCACGYHFASLWEILDPSNLKYTTNLGYNQDDSGNGPPSFISGWVRTGYGSNNSFYPGQANCSNWESTGGFGTIISLSSDWTNSDERDISVWDAALEVCNEKAQVWCVEDMAWNAIVTVTSTTEVSDGDTSSICALIADPGADDKISLREAIEATNNFPGGGTIEFDIPTSENGYNPETELWTIPVTSTLPLMLGGSTFIDGYSQPGALRATDTISASLKIVIDGSSAGSGANGFTITSAGNKIEGLVINQFSENGIRITGNGGTDNTISGNHIGTNPIGSAVLGNDKNGVIISDGAQKNTIGGYTPGERNIISGNGWNGVSIYGSDTMSNTVSGNFIGVDANGTVDLGNTQDGVIIFNGAQNNTTGGNTPGERNIISGNGWNGVSICGSGTISNTISGNYIGIDASGTRDLGNSRDGIEICDTAQNNTIGGNTPGERNIISANGSYGIDINGNGTMGNTVSGNYIGTVTSGMTGLGNNFDGVIISSSAQNNTIGGSTPGERNVISGNGWSGIGIIGSGTTGNTVSGNYIGTDISGTTKLGNNYDGVIISSSAQNNTIGGSTPSERNVISGNEWSGVSINSNNTTDNVVSGNYIGTDASGTIELGNTHDGVIISSGAQSNTIGGSTTGERNVISGNGRYGVNISTSGTNSNTVSGNYIGTNANGTANLGNTYDGVVIYNGAHNNTIGGSTPSKRNVISGNGWSGVGIFDTTTKGNIVSGNYIGTNSNGTVELGNTHNGVLISSGANNNTIGGSTPSGRNVISGNGWSGVGIYGSTTKGNIVSGNYIGTDSSGAYRVGNTSAGVSITDSAQNNTIGGSTPGEWNVISSNGSNGVNISSSAAGNIISGNYIGTDASGILGLGNTSAGVSITDGAQNNIVGGSTPGERNIISDNGSYGVDINGSGTTGNTISGNYIGIDARGTVDLGNTQDGVKIYAGAQNNNVGPGNLITSNSLDGIQIEGSITTGNTITQNSIFLNNKGIHLVNSANGGIPAPVIYAATLGSTNIVGNACSDCTVEVFENSDTDGEGETYIGSTTASMGGFFTLFVSSLGNPYLTATATDVISGTSEFSEMINWTERYIHLPLVMKNY